MERGKMKWFPSTSQEWGLALFVNVVFWGIITLAICL